MGLFLFKRFLTLLVTLVGTSVVVFLVLEILPGDAAQILMGPDAAPFDLGNFAKPGYYWGYESPQFNALFEKIQNAPRAADRAKLLGDAQRMLANDSVHAFLYQPQWITVANKNLKGLWKNMPIFVNDLATLSWS